MGAGNEVRAASSAVVTCLSGFVHVLLAVRVSQLLLSVSNHPVHTMEALSDTPMARLSCDRASSNGPGDVVTHWAP